MTWRGGNKDEMGHPQMTERELEEILSGAGSDPDLMAMIAALRMAGTEPPPERMAIEQIRMAAEAARLVTASPTRISRRDLPRSRRRWAAVLTAGVTWKILAASAALAATSVAAATGTLPDPVQSAVAGAASHLGIDLPSGQKDQPTLGQSDQPDIEQPVQPDADQSDQPDGQADRPTEQSDDKDVDQADQEDVDQPDQPDEEETDPDEQDTEETDPDEQDTEETDPPDEGDSDEADSSN